jgi:membrane fusion protein
LGSEGNSLKLQEDASNRVAVLEAEGYRTTLELNQRQQQVSAERSAIHALRQQREQRHGDLKDIEAQLGTLPSEKSDKMAQLENARSELEQALMQLEINQSYEMVAPLSGRIAALQATQGQATTSQTPLLGMVPEGADLEANLLLPSRAIGLIQPEQEVRIRVDAFPYQRFGVVIGHVSQVSKSTYRPGELLAPIEYKDTVYRVNVFLEKTRIQAYGEQRYLTPGMIIMADVTTDRRHCIDFVLDPLRAISLRN